ncbi:MAG: hypothetical protein VYE64_02480 [Planctomycetota bacterium]|nr:hypothetical protein [Planctomycetota bacterium]
MRWRRSTGYPLVGLFRSLLWSVLLSALISPAAVVAVQSQIVLRNLQAPASPVESFDTRAVYLSDGTVVNWDEVLQAIFVVPGSGNQPDLVRQKSFDAILLSRGRALFQLRHRLSLGDWSSLAEVADPLYRDLRGDPKSSEMARQEYLISLGAFGSRLHGDDRAGAIAPFLRACRLEEKFRFKSGLPAWRDLSREQIRDRLHPWITPVFFDPIRAERELDKWILGPNTPQPAEQIYRVALVITSGQYDLARDMIARLEKDQKNWGMIFSAQLELVDKPGNAIEKIRDRQWRESLTSSQDSLVRYILAEADSRMATDADAATLAFLQLVAENEQKDRQLAAASLYHAFLIAERNGRLEEAKIFKSELLDEYPETYHGKKIKSLKQP